MNIVSLLLRSHYHFSKNPICVIGARLYYITWPLFHLVTRCLRKYFDCSRKNTHGFLTDQTHFTKGRLAPAYLMKNNKYIYAYRLIARIPGKEIIMSRKNVYFK